MNLEKIKENKLILGLLLGVVVVTLITVIVMKQAVEPPVENQAVEQQEQEAPPAEEPVAEDPGVVPHPWWLDEAFSRLEAEVTGINVAESYLMVKPLSPPMPEEIKVKISPETIIEKEVGIEKTIADIKIDYLVSLGTREDIREKTEIFQFEWFTAHPPLDEPLDMMMPLPAGEEQWWLEQEVFDLTGEVIEVNVVENYLRVRPVFPPLEQEIRVILEPGFTFEVFEMATKTINDISIRDFIIFDTGEDIREKQVIEKVIRIQLFGDLLH